MARALVRAAVIERATARVPPGLPSKWGDWMRATPHTPQAAASQTLPVGRAPRSGQERKATQMGKVLVSVITSDVGRWARAKKVQSRLVLLAAPRSHRAPGRHRTRSAPDARARPKAKTKARLLRARA